MPIRGWHHSRPWTWLGGCALMAALLLVLAGCSTSLGSGSGSTNISLGLAGSTADHPSQPPTISTTGPGGTYAFVYDDQIWLHSAGQAGVKQLTHLVLSNGATLSWGPLVWSPGGKYIAFALAQNLAPNTPGRSAAPLYIVDTGTGDTFSTTATGSIYGHTYTWYDDRAIFYSDGGGIMMYDAGDKDPRAWQVLAPFQPTFRAGSTSYYSGQGTTAGDLSIAGSGSKLYFTRITLSALGAAGVVGKADVEEYSLSSFSGYENLAPDDPTLPNWLASPYHLPLTDYADNGSVADLGAAYADSAGNVVAGAWQVSPRGSVLVSEHVDSVNASAGTVSAHYVGCTGFATYGCPAIFGSATAFPIAAHPALAISPDGGSVALATNALYTQSLSGGSAAKVAGAGWTAPPAWSPDSQHVAVTQLVSQSTDASGVVRAVTNTLAVSGGTSAQFIAGASNLAWYYQ